jgi:hypothetical protein
MRLNPAQQRNAPPSGKGASAYRAASRRRPRAGRVVRRRTAIAAGRARRSKRRLLLFYALIASVVVELDAIIVDMEALVLLFSLTALFLCGMLFQAEKA